MVPVRKTVLMILGMLSAFGLASSVQAADSFISEYKFGVLAHDAGIFGRRKEQGADINFEMLFESPGLLRWIGAPRPHLGFEFSTADQTNKGYFGLTWSWVLFNNFYAGFSLGGAAHDGYIRTDRTNRKELGARFGFRESVEFGVVLAERHTISVMLDHISNARLGVKNEGMDGLGIRYGYRF